MRDTPDWAEQLVNDAALKIAQRAVQLMRYVADTDEHIYSDQVEQQSFAAYVIQDLQPIAAALRERDAIERARCVAVVERLKQIAIADENGEDYTAGQLDGCAWLLAAIRDEGGEESE